MPDAAARLRLRRRRQRWRPSHSLTVRDLALIIDVGNGRADCLHKGVPGGDFSVAIGLVGRPIPQLVESIGHKRVQGDTVSRIYRFGDKFVKYSAGRWADTVAG